MQGFILNITVNQDKFLIIWRLYWSSTFVYKAQSITVYAFFGCYYYFGLCWVFVAACGLSLAVVDGDDSLVVVHGLLIAGLVLLQSMSPRGPRLQ